MRVMIDMKNMTEMYSIDSIARIFATGIVRMRSKRYTAVSNMPPSQNFSSTSQFGLDVSAEIPLHVPVVNAYRDLHGDNAE